MNISKVAKILQFELGVNLLSRSFIWGVVMLPLGLCVAVLVGAGFGALVAFGGAGATPIGIVDASGTFSLTGGPCEEARIGKIAEVQIPETLSISTVNAKARATRTASVICARTIEEGQLLVVERKVSQLFVLPRDLSDTGKILHFSREGSSVSSQAGVTNIERFIRERAISKAALPEGLNKLLSGSIDYERFTLQKDGTFKITESEPVSELLGKRASLFGLRLWGVLVVLMSGSVGYGCTRAERTTKLIEIVLSSVTSAEYLLGKVVACTVSTMALITCWFGMGWITVQALKADKWTGITAAFSELSSDSLWIVAFAVVGGTCANLVGAAFGILAKPNEEKSSTALPFSLLQQCGFILAMIVASNPLSTLAVVTSFIPPISASVMVARLGSGELTFLQILAPMLVLLLSTALVMIAAARLMKICLQLEGQGLNPLRIAKTIWNS